MIIIGHRGAAGYEPENTIKSILKGIECGASAIEVDVRRTKDGIMVLMHDETVDRTTNGEGKVSELTLAEIKCLDAGKGERVPTLFEVFELLKERNVILLVELKEIGYEEEVVSMIKDFNMLDRVYITSFHKSALNRVVEIEPNMKTGLIFSSNTLRNMKIAEELNVDVVVPKYQLVNRNFLRSCRRLGFKVFVWTVNRAIDVVKFYRLGVDGIVTDYPCMVKRIINNLISMI
ncbi:MAG: glycerophosphodiester phosphodiesterase [Thermoprotei archaeon]|nr:MAG: glycerophosphodiester phosphodiesterase [Thermoprotei archaeon]